MDSRHPPPYDTPDTFSALRHRWLLLVLAVLLGLGGAGAWLHSAEPVWESTTSVLVHPAGQDTNVVGGRTQGQVNLDTEAQLVRSTAVATGAADRLGGAAAEQLVRQVTIEVPPNTSVLMITFSAGTPQQARAGAAAFADAYLTHRERAARRAVSAQVEALAGKIDELDETLAGLNEQLALTPPDSAAEADLESRRSTVTSQLNSLIGRLNELTTATITAGEVISEARLPADPAQPHPAIILASGAALGLVAGVAAAAVAERATRRVRRPRDLTHRLHLPVVAQLTAGRSRVAPAMRCDEILSPYGVAGRMVDRLRNEVIASTSGQVILVTSATGGRGSSFVAGNLAVSLARCGHDVIVIGARVPDSAVAVNPLTRMLGVLATPGLSEVLTGRAAVAEALQPAPRHPSLRAMTMGGTASATGLLQQPSLRGVLRTLAGQAEYVVVEAPPTSASADTQSLARHCDVALLVVEPRRATLADAADAADQLRRVGTTLLGAVVVPPLRGERGERGSAAPAPDGGHGPDPTAAVGTNAATTDAAAQSTGADHPDGDEPAIDRPGDQLRPARSGPPRPARSGPHLPVLGGPGQDGDTVVLPRLPANGTAPGGRGDQPTELAS